MVMSSAMCGGTTGKPMPLEQDEQAFSYITGHGNDVQKVKLFLSSSLGGGRGECVKSEQMKTWPIVAALILSIF